MHIFYCKRVTKHIAEQQVWHTHIGCFSECLEFLLFERESAEGQRRVLVVFQLGLDLLNLLITLGGETGGERGERRTQDMCCNKGQRERCGKSKFDR